MCKNKLKLVIIISIYVEFVDIIIRIRSFDIW